MNKGVLKIIGISAGAIAGIGVALLTKRSREVFNGLSEEDIEKRAKDDIDLIKLKFKSDNERIVKELKKRYNQVNDMSEDKISKGQKKAFLKIFTKEMLFSLTKENNSEKVPENNSETSENSKEVVEDSKVKEDAAVTDLTLWELKKQENLKKIEFGCKDILSMESVREKSSEESKDEITKVMMERIVDVLDLVVRMRKWIPEDIKKMVDEVNALNEKVFVESDEVIKPVESAESIKEELKPEERDVQVESDEDLIQKANSDDYPESEFAKSILLKNYRETIDLQIKKSGILEFLDKSSAQAEAAQIFEKFIKEYPDNSDTPLPVFFQSQLSLSLTKKRLELQDRHDELIEEDRRSEEIKKNVSRKTKKITESAFEEHSLHFNSLITEIDSIQDKKKKILKYKELVGHLDNVIGDVSLIDDEDQERLSVIKELKFSRATITSKIAQLNAPKPVKKKVNNGISNKKKRE